MRIQSSEVLALTFLLAIGACSTVTVDRYRDHPPRPLDHPIVVYESLSEIGDREYEKVGRLLDVQKENQGLVGIFERSGLEEVKREARKIGADALVLDTQAERQEVTTTNPSIPVPLGSHKGNPLGTIDVGGGSTTTYCTRRSILAIRWLDAASQLTEAAISATSAVASDTRNR